MALEEAKKPSGPANAAASTPPKAEEKRTKERVELDPFTTMSILQAPTFSLISNLRMFAPDFNCDTGGFDMIINMKILDKLKTAYPVMSDDSRNKVKMAAMFSGNSNKEGNGGGMFGNMDPMTMMFMMNGMNGNKEGGSSGGMNPIAMMCMVNQMNGGNKDGKSNNMFGNMDPMTMMCMLGGGDMSMMFPIMMMNQNKGKDGKSGGMDPMTMMFMMNGMNGNKEGNGGGMFGNMDPMTMMFMMNGMGGNKEGGGMDMNSLMPLIFMGGFGGNKDKEGKPAAGGMDPMTMMFMMNSGMFGGGAGGNGDMSQLLKQMMFAKLGESNPNMKFMLSVMSYMGNNGMKPFFT